MRYSDEEILKIVGEERKRSIGFGEGDSGELQAQRERALKYAKGEMSDIPALPNRSAVVDTAIADAIETVLPDVMEVFVGGEDVATFVPEGEDDEDKAQEETEFVQHVVFTENPGFLILYSAIKDALLTRTGIVGWWWEEEEGSDPVTEAPAEAAPMLQAIAQQQGMELEAEAREDGTVALTTPSLHGKVCIKAYPSEDFTVSTDTVWLPEATYCAVRARARVQDLIARGIDADKARELKPYARKDNTVSQARDEADESQITVDGATGDLREVEVRDHYIRLADGDGKLSIWRVTTDSEETMLLDKEEVEQIPFAAFTPYIVPHRFHGESVADKLIEVQRIKTVLLRMLLDSGYFALNQRTVVDMTRAGEFTISDLLNNTPGMPIRVQGEGAVMPMVAGALNFDVLSAMEFVSTIAEQRSGIVRNAQGLNPDTLHDTAKGAMALIQAAQKRVRMIARVFAETGVRDLFIGVHRLLRSGYSDEHKPASFRRGGKWSEVKPHQWPERCAMAVHVGVGSAGREHDMMIATQRLELIERVLASGELGSMVLDPSNVHNALIAWETSTGNKGADRYWSDPKSKPPPEPKPDPEMMKAQGQLQIKQAETQANLQMKAQEGQQKAQLDAAQGQRDHELAMTRLQMEMDLKREQIGAELQLKREQLQAELALKRELGFAQAAVTREVGHAKVSASTSEVEPGGEPG